MRQAGVAAAPGAWVGSGGEPRRGAFLWRESGQGVGMMRLFGTYPQGLWEPTEMELR